MTEAVVAGAAAAWDGVIESQLAHLEARLIAEFGGGVHVEATVREHLAGARQSYAGARVQTFLPILIERTVRRRLHSQPLEQAPTADSPSTGDVPTASSI